MAIKKLKKKTISVIERSISFFFWNYKITNFFLLTNKTSKNSINLVKVFIENIIISINKVCLNLFKLSMNQ